MAWGGPVAQIAMIHRELVTRERWITPEKFNRVLAVYQALPGPEATELCCYFGMVARGRLGAVVAGLGFLLPGFFLMVAASWAYCSFDPGSRVLVYLSLGVTPVVAALIVLGAVRLGWKSLASARLVIIAAGAATMEFLGCPFWATLILAGLAGVSWRWWPARVACSLLAASAVWWWWPTPPDPRLGGVSDCIPSMIKPSQWNLLATGLKAGLLTFGGAYTAIPVVRHDAVWSGAPGETAAIGWMQPTQFGDAIAIASLVPAPLVMFVTLVGYAGGGPLGAVLMTVGVFAPAFGFTLIGHDHLERVANNPRFHALLDAVAAAAIGIFLAFAWRFVDPVVLNPSSLAMFLVAMSLMLWKRRWWVVPVLTLAGSALTLVINRNSL